MSALPKDFPVLLTESEERGIKWTVEHCKECLGRGKQRINGVEIMCHCVRKAYGTVIEERRKAAVLEGDCSKQTGDPDPVRECDGTGGDCPCEGGECRDPYAGVGVGSAD